MPGANRPDDTNLQVRLETERRHGGGAAMRNAATSQVTDGDRPRYVLHYKGRDGRDRGGVIRAFDQPLLVGQEFAGVDGLCRVVRIEEGESNDVAHAWLEPADA